MVVVLICEKPSAAKTIAEALADSKPRTVEGVDGVKYYKFVKDGREHVSVAAVGHLFSLKQKGKGWNYPRFDVDWIPAFEATKMAAFSEKYFRTIESVAKDADDCIIATDYDDEGSVIGYNILRFMFGRKDAARMRFSTMTQDELIKSYEHPEKAINKGQVEAGLARHYLDYIWGVNLTRALTLAIKNAAQRFVILSTGRVQGPVLHMLAKHEKKIRAFKPKPFWEILLKIKLGSQYLDAVYEKDKIWDKAEAKAVFAKLKDNSGVVADIQTRLMTQKAPIPYNTTSLLADTYRYFGYSPKQGLDIAETLYQAGLISYPRTSSQRLPKDIGYEKIIKKLSQQTEYKIAENLLNRRMEPAQGQRTDPAHPAVYPTGEKPKRALNSRQKNVYDLVVRRFLSCFGEPAKRESIRVTMDVNGQKFYFNGKKTIEPGWTELYGKYAKREEILLPKLKKGDKIPVTKKEMLDKETPPPARFSQGSVLKEMEEKELGTKATRAQILQTLYSRGYLVGQSIEVTDLGMSVSDILEKNVPDVVSESLTRHFEEETENIQAGRATRDAVVKEAEKELTKISEEFKKKEAKIGKELTASVIDTQEKAAELGPCPKCKGILSVHKSWRTKKRFVGCSNYKNGCKTGFPLPAIGTIISTDKICDKCKTPIIQVGRMGARPFRMCLDPECVTKKDWLNKKTLKKAKDDSIASKNDFEKLQARAESLGLKCAECNKIFQNKRGLGIHMKRAHK